MDEEESNFMEKISKMNINKQESLIRAKLKDVKEDSNDFKFLKSLLNQLKNEIVLKNVQIKQLYQLYR